MPSRKTSTRKTAKRGNSSQRKGIKTQSQNQQGMVMYSSPRTVMPTQFNTTLKYLIDTVVTNVGNTQASVRYRNEAFDVDPSLGSTAMPGFAEFANFYQRFRVLRLAYKFSCANQEAFSLTLIHGFSVNSIASGSLNLQYAGNPMFQSSIVGPATGMNTKIFKGSRSIVDISGTKQALYDDLYSGSTTSATVSANGTVYCNLGVIAPVVLTALGVLLTAEVTLTIQFYRPTFLLS
jgi:hypothetical protein